MKLLLQSKRSRPALRVSMPLLTAYPPPPPLPASHIRRDQSSPSARPTASQSQDAQHAGRTSTSSSPPPLTAYSSSPRSPGAAHPALEKRTDSPPSAPPRASLSTQSHPH